MEAIGSVEEFLGKCETSGDAAYGLFRLVLERLEDPSTRTQARIFLADLQKRLGDFDQCLEKYHFRIQDIVLDQYEGSLHFTLLTEPLLFAGR